MTSGASHGIVVHIRKLLQQVLVNYACRIVTLCIPRMNDQAWKWSIERGHETAISGCGFDVDSMAVVDP